MLISINPENPQQRLIDKIVQQLRLGATMCYPTDTGYGIGCDMFNQKAIKKIYQIKKRPKHKPLTFMCSGLKNISEYAHVSNTAYRLLKKNLPGPYTFVLPGTKLKAENRRHPCSRFGYLQTSHGDTGQPHHQHQYTL